jgi:hypothetical protein
MEKKKSKELEKLYKAHRLLTEKKRTLEDISSYGGHNIVFTKSDRGNARPAEVRIFANSNHEDMGIAHDIIKYAIRQYQKQMQVIKSRIDHLCGQTDFKVYASVNSLDVADHVFVAKKEPYENPEDVSMKCIGAHFAVKVSNDILCPIKLVTDSRELGYNLEHCRPANSQEINVLLNELKKHNLTWDKYVQRLVPKDDIKSWSHTTGEPYWVCMYYRVGGFTPILFMDEFDYPNELVKGWVYRSKQDCQRMCDKLNEALDDVEPYRERKDD